VEDAEAGMSCIDRSRPGGSLLLRVDGVRGVTPGRRRWIVRHARDDARYQLSLVLTGANLCILPTDKCTPRPGGMARILLERCFGAHAKGQKGRREPCLLRASCQPESIARYRGEVVFPWPSHVI